MADQQISYGVVRVCGGDHDKGRSAYHIVRREPGRADTILAHAWSPMALELVDLLNHAHDTQTVST